MACAQRDLNTTTEGDSNDDHEQQRQESPKQAAPVLPKKMNERSRHRCDGDQAIQPGTGTAPPVQQIGDISGSEKPQKLPKRELQLSREGYSERSCCQKGPSC